MSSIFSIQVFLILVLSFSNTLTINSAIIPSINPQLGIAQQKPQSTADVIAKDFKTFYYSQTLDHFNYRPESYTKFKQRYVTNFKYWGGANSNAPIFAYLGEEVILDDILPFISPYLTHIAAQFNALIVHMEHRFYGKAVPFGSFTKAIENAKLRGYFNSAQALADYADILIYLKNKLRANYSPVIVIGVSYGGMLASWFRLKYPHIALGALASSAPILYFDNITPEDGFYSVVTKDFREASETCYETIRESWSEIDNVASKHNGLSILSNKFRTCEPLKDSSELKNYLIGFYENAAQYDAPPAYPVALICEGIDGAAFGDDVLSKIFAGVFAFTGNNSCYVNQPSNPTETNLGWHWQSCSEIVFTIGITSNPMFPHAPFNLNSYIKDCKSAFGVAPRPHWITTYYGGHDIKLILQRFGSNIIFSNGLRDPYISGGVLENISDTIVAINTDNGSHGLDITGPIANAPDWLATQRKAENEIIKKWIATYYADLHAYKY